MSDRPGVTTAMAGIQHHNAAHQSMARGSDQLFFSQRVRRTARDRPGEIREGPQGPWPDAAVHGQPYAALEPSYGLLGVGTEHAVDPVGAEPQRQEALLE